MSAVSRADKGIIRINNYVVAKVLFVLYSQGWKVMLAKTKYKTLALRSHVRIIGPRVNQVKSQMRIN